METQTASVKKIGLSYGLIMALLTIGLSVVVYVMDMHLQQPWWQSLLSFIIMIAVIVMGIKAFKAENGGYLSLGEALKTGLAISVIAAIIGIIFQYIFMNYIEPDFVNQMLDVQREKMIERNMPDDQIEMAMGITEKMMSPGIMMAVGLISTLFIGFIISLISGLIMKVKRPDQQ